MLISAAVIHRCSRDRLVALLLMLQLLLLLPQQDFFLLPLHELEPPLPRCCEGSATTARPLLVFLL